MSNGRLLNRLAVTAEPFDIRNIVWPSGAERATVSAATTPPAPGRFSIVTDCPSDLDSSFATMRAVRSPTPPGPKGTTMRSGFAGYAPCASAAETGARSPAATVPQTSRRRLADGRECKLSPRSMLGHGYRPPEEAVAGVGHCTNCTNHKDSEGNSSSSVVRTTSLARKGSTPL